MLHLTWMQRYSRRVLLLWYGRRELFIRRDVRDDYTRLKEQGSFQAQRNAVTQEIFPPVLHRNLWQHNRHDLLWELLVLHVEKREDTRCDGAMVKRNNL